MDHKKYKLYLKKKIQQFSIPLIHKHSFWLCPNMLEFIFGALIGVWAAQQFSLPSVQSSIKHWWFKQSTPPPPNPEIVKEEVPIFTGDMPVDGMPKT